RWSRVRGDRVDLLSPSGGRRPHLPRASIRITRCRRALLEGPDSAGRGARGGATARGGAAHPTGSAAREERRARGSSAIPQNISASDEVSAEGTRADQLAARTASVG